MTKQKLIIAEKPSVAKNYAAALGCGDSHRTFFEGNGYLISWCVGHLVELMKPEGYNPNLKKWRYETLPIIPGQWRYEVKKEMKAQFETLKKLMNREDVESVVCGTDAGREGELIFRMVYEQAGCTKPIERLWLSSMEESAIKKGIENLCPGSDYEDLYQSALCRQYADWIVGINGTRLFTVLCGGRVLKVGRVQTPTLAMIVEREAEIANFHKEPYYVVHLKAGNLEAVSEKLTDRSAADETAVDCQGGMAQVGEVRREAKSILPPKLYDLTSLQRDANRKFGYTAKETLEYTQSLYEKKLATYPRTDSRYLTEDMGETAENVIVGVFEKILCQEKGEFQPDTAHVMDNRKVSDHHAVIPTAEILGADFSALTEGEVNILSLLGIRLVCACAPKHTYEAITAEITCMGHTFSATGKLVKNEGWKRYEQRYRQIEEEKRIWIGKEEQSGADVIQLQEGMMLAVDGTEVVTDYTRPPQHFTEDSLLSAMERAGAKETDDAAERKGLGTPATRADIIEKLVHDGFLIRSGKQLHPTADGANLISILPKELKSAKLTSDWENALIQVANGELAPRVFMDGICDMVERLIEENSVMDEEKKALFADETRAVRQRLGACPKCGEDVLAGKYGAYCTVKCGMNVGIALGKKLDEAQVRSLLDGKKILVKGLKSRKGSL